MSKGTAERVEFVGPTGLALVADFYGSGQQHVVMMHGGGQTRHSWGGTAATLASNGYTAWSLDLRGHGESDWAPDGNYALSTFAADLVSCVAQIAEMAPGAGKPVIVGASLGGLTGLWALGKLDPRLAAGLVLVDVVPEMNVKGTDRIRDFMLENAKQGFGSLEEAAESVAAYNSHRTKPPSPEGLKKNLRERDGRWYWHWDPAFVGGTAKEQFPSEIMDSSKLNACAVNVQVPLMLVRGRMSDVVDEAGAQSFLRLVPDAQYVDVSGAGHMVAGDKNDRFTSATVQFLSQLTP